MPSRAVDYPFGTWGCEGGKTDTIATLTKDRTIGEPIAACFDNPTIAGEADAAGVSWRFYRTTSTATADSGRRIKPTQIYNGPDWNTDVISPPSQFLTDIGNGELANVTWITPTYGKLRSPRLRLEQRPGLGRQLVERGRREQVLELDGDLHHVGRLGRMVRSGQPPYKDYDGLGFRVPLIVISPYASRLRHARAVRDRERAALHGGQLRAAAAGRERCARKRSGDRSHAFDYTQKPRTFKKIAGGKPDAYWIQLERQSLPSREAGNHR